MNIRHYTYRVTWSPEDDEHVGLCAEFASLSWLAKTPEAALKGIQKVVGDVVADMLANGEWRIRSGGDGRKKLQRRVPRTHSAAASSKSCADGCRARRKP